jgi:threonine dehydratase
MPKRYIEKILKARVYDVARETPLDIAPNLSRRMDNRVFLKREDMQPVFSFKLRGAYNKIINLPDDKRREGVIAASAGNHAQGVALSAQRLGIKALIVMPTTTPPIKIEAVKNLGAKAVVHGDTYDEAYTHAQELAAQRSMTFIHPYDDPDVIAGQGTVGMEILHQHTGGIHAIFVPVGGGGLIAGIAAYVKYLYPDIKVIGVEPDEAPSMYQALQKNRRIRLPQVGIFTDGAAVRQVGKEPFRIARQCVDQVIVVNTDAICAAIKDIFDDTRSIAEPAGALAVAGLKKYVEDTGVRDKDLVAIESGANMNFDRLRHVSERAELGERREMLVVVTIPERPGSFRDFCQSIGHRNITEFNYRMSDAREAHVFAGIQLNRGEEERLAILAQLRKGGYAVIDLTDNEMAKLHIRHMVGGHAPAISDEKIYRFEFPERPGALLRFLTRMGRRWNISMFHYRNHGDAFGRVLVGVQVPSNSQDQFHGFLKDLGYAFHDESANLAYALFLS